MKNNVNLHKQLCDDIHNLYIQKNTDYGSSASKSYQEFGMTAYLIRLSDKLNRLKTLSKQEQLVKDESIKDTLMDMAGYCLLALVDLETEDVSRET
jgi:hypothetical protein